VIIIVYFPISSQSVKGIVGNGFSELSLQIKLKVSTHYALQASFLVLS